MCADPLLLSVEDLLDHTMVDLFEPQQSLVLFSGPTEGDAIVRGLPANRPLPQGARVLAVVASVGDRPVVMLLHGTQGQDARGALNVHGPLFDLVAVVANDLRGDKPSRLQRARRDAIGRSA